MPHIPGFDIPESLYLVCCQPALLAGMRKPDAGTPWRHLSQAGIHRVVCLTENAPEYFPEPLVIAGHYPLRDLYGGALPDDPASEQARIHKACERVVSLMSMGFGVAVHCDGGTGRTGTVIGCALKALGYNSMLVVKYLDQVNHLRGEHRGWPESKWQVEVVINYSGLLIDPSNMQRLSEHD